MSLVDLVAPKGVITSWSTVFPPTLVGKKSSILHVESVKDVLLDVRLKVALVVCPSVLRLVASRNQIALPHVSVLLCKIADHVHESDEREVGVEVLGPYRIDERLVEE